MIKKIFKSTFMGVLALLAVNFTAVFTGVSLSVNAVTLSISAVLGMPGVLSLLVLGYLIK